MNRKTLMERSAAGFFLGLAFVSSFPEIRFLFSKVFLTGDSLTYYYPLAAWAQSKLAEGRLPLLSDLAYHGAPLAAQSSIGLLSPILLALLALPLTPAYNLIHFLPLAISLIGFYRLGRTYGFPRTGALFFSLLASLNGAADARLSLFIVGWANAFFPWTWMFVYRFARKNRALDAWAAAAAFGLTVATGHPQMALMQGLTLAFWALAAPESTWRRRVRSLLLAVGGGLVLSAPRWLHTLECVFRGAGASFQWSDLDAYFHSWTPFNVVTMVFPAFFGRSFLTGGGDYWWLYHYNEMQFNFGLVALVFLILFFSRKSPDRFWVSFASGFFILMALGRFGPVYPLLRRLPPFEWFRDPARWLIPAGWVLSFGAARAWTRWIGDREPSQRPARVALWLFAASVGFLWVARWITGTPSILRHAAGFFIRRFVKGDALHPATVDAYLARLPEKLAPLERSLDFSRPEVWVPLLVLAAFALAAASVRLLPRRAIAVSFLLLSLFELSFFGLRLGADGFLDPRSIPASEAPAPKSRLFALTPDTPLPAAALVLRLGFPNANFLDHRAALPLFLYPALPRYEEICSRLGWMSWLYRDRDPEGWKRRPNLLRALGTDLVVSSAPLSAKPPFHVLRRRFPYAVEIRPVAGKAVLYGRVEIAEWPALLDLMEKRGWDPLKTAFVEKPVHPVPLPGLLPEPRILNWENLGLEVETAQPGPALLVLQKTYLPAWKAEVNGRSVPVVRAQGVLAAVALPPGPCRVTLSFRATGLLLSFFLSLVFMALGGALAVLSYGGPLGTIRRSHSSHRNFHG